MAVCQMRIKSLKILHTTTTWLTDFSNVPQPNSPMVTVHRNAGHITKFQIATTEIKKQRYLKLKTTRN